MKRPIISLSLIAMLLFAADGQAKECKALSDKFLESFGLGCFDCSVNTKTQNKDVWTLTKAVVSKITRKKEKQAVEIHNGKTKNTYSAIRGCGMGSVKAAMTIESEECDIKKISTVGADCKSEMTLNDETCLRVLGDSPAQKELSFMSLGGGIGTNTPKDFDHIRTLFKAPSVVPAGSEDKAILFCNEYAGFFHPSETNKGSTAGAQPH